MLILTRRIGESIMIGDDIKVSVVELKGNQIRLGLTAPTDLGIYREEIYLRIQQEKAADGAVKEDGEQFDDEAAAVPHCCA